MKFKMILPIAALTIALAGACKNDQKIDRIQIADNAPLFAKGDKTPAVYFTGNAYLKPLIARDKNNDFVMGSVSFEPGARTNWHIHPKGQVLIVTEGEGFYQQKGKPAQPLKRGDIVNVPEGVEHWHGASAKSAFAHIALTNFKDEKNVSWLMPVSEEDYAAVNKK